MTRLDVVTMISELIAQVDMLLASSPLDDPSRQRLLDLEILLNDRQRRLAQAELDDTSPAFQAMAAQLRAIHNQITNTAAAMADVNATLGNIERFAQLATRVAAMGLSGEDEPEVP